jgi:hypothetical protein
LEDTSLALAGGRLAWLKGGSAASEEVDEEGENDRADGGDEDADDEAVLAGTSVAEGAEDGSSDDGADEADDHVHEPAEAGAFHDESGEPACDDADDDPAKDAVSHVVTLLGFLLQEFRVFWSGRSCTPSPPPPSGEKSCSNLLYSGGLDSKVSPH